ncbi:MAG: hypothetical protein JO227_00985 [Acetobacteraceae bacterium]|nr:hypothetical protein [Acetobacteraceae bacterium]
MQNRLLENWGCRALAKQWHTESIEEMRHADRLIERIIFLDGSPNMQTLDSLHIGKTITQVIERDLGGEMTARALYEQAATHCAAVRDYVTRRLFEDLLQNEEAHANRPATCVRQYRGDRLQHCPPMLPELSDFV